MTEDSSEKTQPENELTFASSGVAGVHYARCWPCQLGLGEDCFDPPQWHPWVDGEDIDHARNTGQTDPSKSRCACPCAVVET